MKVLLFFLFISITHVYAQKKVDVDNFCSFEYIGNIVDSIRVFHPLGGNKVLPIVTYVNESEDRKMLLSLSLIPFNLLKDDFESAIEGLHIEVEERDDNLKIGNRNFRFVSGTKVEKGVVAIYNVVASNSIDKVLIFRYDIDRDKNIDAYLFEIISTYKCK